MTREQIIEKGKKYDRMNNEGGEGFNPYWAAIRDGDEAVAEKKHSEIDFAKEWTKEETQQRRESWNAFVRSITNSQGQITDPAKMHKQAKEQGWGVDDLRKAVKLHAK